MFDIRYAAGAIEVPIELSLALIANMDSIRLQRKVSPAADVLAVSVVPGSSS
jgi:hypothetical protein